MFAINYLSSWIFGSSSSSTPTKNGKQEAPMHPYRSDRDIVVTTLQVFPVKSCQGIRVKSSKVFARGLEFDREWALRENETRKLIGGREHPKLAAVTTEFDFDENILVVAFPKESNLPGFSVRLRIDPEEMRDWERTDERFFFEFWLPGSAICPTVTSSRHPDPVPPASEQFSTYIGVPLTFMRLAPEDDRTAPPPRGDNERTVWLNEMEKVGMSMVRFMDEHPLVIASEASHRWIEAAVRDAAKDEPTEAKYKNIGPTFDKKQWTTKPFDAKRRFRSNIIVGAPRDLVQDGLANGTNGHLNGVADEMGAFEEETWGHIAIGRSGCQEDEQVPILINCRHGRCQIPNIEPETGVSDKAVPYKIIIRTRRVDPAVKYVPCFGVTSVPRYRQGFKMINVGDVVSVLGGNNWESSPPK